MRWLHRNRALPKLAHIEAERICLIKPSALGDVVQTLPVLSALRERFPHAHIAWVVNQGYADLLTDHPDLDEVISFRRPRAGWWAAETRRSLRDLRDRLRAGRFDLVCDLQGLLRSGLMTWATGARRRVGLGDAREGARFFYTDVVSIPAEDISAVDRYWLMAEALGAKTGPKRFRIALSAADLEWASRRIARLADLTSQSTKARSASEGDEAETPCLRVGLVPPPAATVAIHPGARWTTKRWPAEHFAEIARRLAGDSDANLILVGGPEERATAEQIQVAVPRHCTNLVGQTTLKQLAAVLSRVDLLITNDSGPMHLAAALGTPVAAIFTCTSPQRARPYGPGHLLLGTNVWCAASYLKRCSRMECMTELTPDRVWPAIRNQVAVLRSRSAA